MNSKKEFLEILLLIWDSFAIKISTTTVDFYSPGSNITLKRIKEILLDEGIIDENGIHKTSIQNKEKSDETYCKCYA